jgi:hypothetical protein
MKIKHCLLIAVLLIPGFLHAQDTLTMLNGNQKIVNVKEVNSRLLYISYQNVKKNRAKLKAIELLDVYSVGYKDSARQITYVQDSNLGLVLDVDQMGSYIHGEQYAKAHYKGVGYWVGGAVAGFGGPYFLNYFYGLLVPAAYTGVVAAIPAGTKKLARQEPALYADAQFVDGYKHKVRKKSVMGALYGSLIGIGVAGVTTAIIMISSPEIE